jgi:adenylosuccinate lyase
VIDRYTRPRMGAVWIEETKLANWLRIEILATEARALRGEVPQEDLEEIKAKATFDVDRVLEIEKITRHDVAAFIDNVSESVGPASRHLHYGMTSSDILDTGLALQMRQAADLLLEELTKLINITVRLAREHAGTLMAGRTHGIHAEPITFGLKVAGWAWELHRGRERLERARETVSVGKLSGAVGSYSQLPPAIEAYVCGQLGLRPDPSSTQVIARDRHAEFACTLGVVAGSIERMATEIRHLARTEVGEAEEPFAAGMQKGSSAMPHKRNPWRSERLTGLARIVRASVVPAIEDIALWHERDISHSSVERVMLPDACIGLDFMLAEAQEIVGGLVVHADRMRSNLDRSCGLLFSQRVLLALVDAGIIRDDAYRIVQENSMRAWESGTHLRDLLKTDERVTGLLTTAQIDQCFDESRYLQHAGEVIARLAEVERS